MNDSDSILGRTVSGALSAEELEVWSLSRPAVVLYETEELSALCPVTGQPDIYHATITYTAAATFESKGMKHYLWGFRDVGISCEHLAQRIADELTSRLGVGVGVHLIQQVRGGLTLSTHATGVST